MVNRIQIDPEHLLGTIDRDIFGGFAEHIGRCIYGGIYEPGSPLADANGLRTDVLAALRRLRMPNMRFPGGNFASGYRWQDGVGPLAERPPRYDLAWHSINPNTFGTNEFMQFCRALGTEPNMVINCGDGDMRETQDWVEYCNGTWDSAMVRLRRHHGYDAPHRVKYWGIGNEVEGRWQIGQKTPQEYARTCAEYAKVMKWVDPKIKIIAAGTCLWGADMIERARLLLEQAGDLIDYLSVHLYVENRANHYVKFMALSEEFEDKLTAYEGLMRSISMGLGLKRPIAIAFDEWNVWYRATIDVMMEEVYNLEDALVIGMYFNAFIRHARSVRMANLAQIVNVLAPILTKPDGLVLQSTFYPFELYSELCGTVSVASYFVGDTFSGGDYKSVPVLDISATMNPDQRQLTLFVVNRSQDETVEAEIRLSTGSLAGTGRASVVNGPHIKAENTFAAPDVVQRRDATLMIDRSPFVYAFEPHSVTALVCPVR